MKTKMVFRMTRFATLFVACGALLGCVRHYDHNAPKDIDVENPPKDITVEGAQKPQDPGKHFVVGSVGVFGTVGRAAFQDDTHSFQTQFGLETSIIYGLPHKTFLFPFFLYLDKEHNWSTGLNIGWVAAEKQGPQLVPAYLEAHLGYFLFAISGGIAADFVTDLYGPQATAWFGPLFFRFTQLVGGRRDIVVGLAIELPYIVLSWGR